MQFKMDSNSNLSEVHRAVQKLQKDVYKFVWNELKSEKLVEIRSFINGPVEYKTNNFSITVHPPELVQDLNHCFVRVQIVRRSNP